MFISVRPRRARRDASLILDAPSIAMAEEPPRMLARELSSQSDLGDEPDTQAKVEATLEAGLHQVPDEAGRLAAFLRGRQVHAHV